MNRLHLCLTVLTLLAATEAQSGAWPRGAGKGFAALSTRIADGTLPSEPPWRASLYLDYGLTARRSLALELDGTPGRLEKALVFHNLSLLARHHPRKLAFSLGVGVIDAAAAVSPRLSTGRAIEIFGIAGWAEATLAAEITHRTTAGKLDLTLGLSPTPRLRSYLQLFAYQARGGTPYIRAETSFAYRLTPRLWIDAGISTGISPDRDHRLKLGFWTAF